MPNATPLPTRLLHWTESLSVAIYFALYEITEVEISDDKISPPCIWMLNPFKLNELSINGQLKVLPGKVVISRKGAMGFLTQGLKGDKEIRIKDLSIQLKKAGLAANGFIQFTFFGGAEHKGGILDSTKDENTIMFTKAQMTNSEKQKI